MICIHLMKMYSLFFSFQPHRAHSSHACFSARGLLFQLFLGHFCCRWLYSLLPGWHSNLATLKTLWLEQQVPVIFGPPSCSVCACARVRACVLPWYLYIFRRIEIHTCRLRQKGPKHRLCGSPNTPPKGSKPFVYWLPVKVWSTTPREREKGLVCLGCVF